MKKAPQKKSYDEQQKDSEETRLNKFISHNSKYSRREADTLISEGKVSINGKVVTDLSQKVTNEDKVEVNGKRIKFEENKMYTVIVYNKPKGELVTKSDPQGRKTIYDSLGAKFKHFLPIGRLDYASEGVLLLSDNVDVVNALMHSNLERIYRLKISGYITSSMIKAMEEGITIEDASKGAHKHSEIKSMTFAPFNAYQIQKNDKSYSKIKVVISEGKNRELRRFFGYFDSEVKDLKRVEFGGISLNNLPTGKTRYLTKDEYKSLRTFLKDNAKTSNLTEAN
ncbi:pseudouridine synthase [Arcobacter sp. FWKO B]|uniref:pseudouridine synthase n=1 Tax=Arcobacter sp. FWKO B TaxID=2593672 RepID=UPI0018A38013|nr:pseudouridine synthase [Arcobacter sp. FWKO B]QOG13266.1 rRNA pseudouridine synthase [Arcobacter sp. FWKO B]